MSGPQGSPTSTLEPASSDRTTPPPVVGLPGPRAPRGRRRGAGHRAPIRWGRVAAVLLVVAALIVGLVDDLRTQVRLHHTEVEQTQTRHAVELAGRVLHITQGMLRRLAAGQHVDQAALNVVEGELATAEQRLAQAEAGLALSNLDVAAIKACITGTQGAIAAIASGQDQSAITIIGGVAPACESLEGPGPGGPVYPFDFPDPDLIDVGSTYYGYGTNAAGGNVQIIESTDLTHFALVGDALPELPDWATPGDTWAPGVFELGSRFVMFYATDDGRTECISVATATSPIGPFVDHSTGPLLCQRTLGGSIDPSPYLSASGAPYLTWKSNGGSGQPATVWAQALSTSGTALAPGSAPVALLQPTQSWEGGVVEGPFMWSSDGAYDLFYSANNWDSADYAEGVATCAGPLGPCTKPLAGPILTSQASFAGPGGASVFLDAQGNPQIAFHGWLPAAVGYPNARLLFIRPLSFTGATPTVGPAG